MEGKLARAYDMLFSGYLKPIRKKIMHIARKYECKSIVDLGCGTGQQCIMLFKQGFQVVGVDASPHMINFARKNSPKEIKYVLSDILSFDAKNTFDCVILAFVLHGNNAEKQRKILEKMKGMIKDDGIVIIADYGKPENIKGKLMNILIKIVEGMAAKEHSRNYKLYVKNGGLRWIMKKQNIIEHYAFYGGAIRIVVLSNSS